MKSPAYARLVDYLRYSGPTHVARNGIVYMVDPHYPEGDERRYNPSATCVPYGQTPEISEASSEDIAFMLRGYWRALFLFYRINKEGLTPDLRHEIEVTLAADEKHMLRNSGQ